MALAEAIGILNTVLPPSHRIRMGRQDDLKLKDALSQGEIVIGFMPRKEWPETVRNQFSALSTIRAFGFPFQPAGEPLERIVGGVIFVDSDHIKQRGNSVVDTLLHEFLHVFGRLHPKQGTFPHTIMNHGAPVRPAALSLSARHCRLEDGLRGIAIDKSPGRLPAAGAFNTHDERTNHG